MKALVMIRMMTMLALVAQMMTMVKFPKISQEAFSQNIERDFFSSLRERLCQDVV